MAPPRSHVLMQGCTACPAAVLVLCAFTWVLAAIACSLACLWVAGLHAYGHHTRAQVSFAIALCALVATWAAAEVAAVLHRRVRPSSADAAHPHSQPIEKLALVEERGTGQPPASVIGQPDEGQGSREIPKDVEVASVDAGTAVARADTAPSRAAEPWQAALAVTPEVLRLLRACSELALICAFTYVCDRTEVFPKSEKRYDPKQFWGLWLLLIAIALFTVKQAASDKAMHRDQTDEWKGWMQIMFIMYHYFAEKEVYNAIRIYIAAYVWMTGYGNFCLYARRKDAFSLRRLLHVLFRLNFLGFCMCILLNNEYMLYYICAMHTLFTLFVMAVLHIKRKLNSSLQGVYAKLAGVALLVALLYDGPSAVFRAVFGTLPVVRPLMAFHDPLHPEFTDEMHEWHFRSGLDRFIWIVGMLFAFHVNDVQGWLEWVEAQTFLKRAARYAVLVFVVAIIAGPWWHFVFKRGKFDYNKFHPFTSWVPITVYLLMRNCLPALRRRYLGLFAYMGKYTLETYIFQFHIWMRTTGLNGSPRHLLQWIPEYFWANFVLVTAVYLLVSVRFFNLTAVLSETLIRKEPCELAAVVVCIGFGIVVCSLASGLFVE
mmetsp:Transcript_111241/g.309802  ORF Transcript_111241/g.309802 Transcript_111241/m.309802 type:complete len:601 (-) Transcript_111241:179-1981(-)